MILAACLAALLTGQAADLATTAKLRAPQYREGNPMLPYSFAGILTIKAGATTALAVSGWRIRHRHPKLAAGLFLAGAVSGTVGAWHNASILRSHP